MLGVNVLTQLKKFFENHQGNCIFAYVEHTSQEQKIFWKYFVEVIGRKWPIMVNKGKVYKIIYCSVLVGLGAMLELNEVQFF